MAPAAPQPAPLEQLEPSISAGALPAPESDASETNDAPAAADIPETLPTDAAPAPEVVLSFTGNCWVEVRDAERRILFTGEFRAGDQRRIEGAAPYRLIIGNTALARLSIDGEPYDLGAHARGNVARFTLDPSEIN